VLRRDGVLGAAHVTEGEVESSRDTILSRIIRIGLKYDAGAGQVPRTLILMARAGNPRCGDPDQSWTGSPGSG
jgi:hypothetical protein